METPARRVAAGRGPVAGEAAGDARAGRGGALAALAALAAATAGGGQGGVEALALAAAAAPAESPEPLLAAPFAAPPGGGREGPHGFLLRDLSVAPTRRAASGASKLSRRPFAFETRRCNLFDDLRFHYLPPLPAEPWSALEHDFVRRLKGLLVFFDRREGGGGAGADGARADGARADGAVGDGGGGAESAAGGVGAKSAGGGSARDGGGSGSGSAGGGPTPMTSFADGVSRALTASGGVSIDHPFFNLTATELGDARCFIEAYVSSDDAADVLKSIESLQTAPFYLPTSHGVSQWLVAARLVQLAERFTEFSLRAARRRLGLRRGPAGLMHLRRVVTRARDDLRRFLPRLPRLFSLFWEAFFNGRPPADATRCSCYFASVVGAVIVGRLRMLDEEHELGVPIPGIKCLLSLYQHPRLWFYLCRADERTFAPCLYWHACRERLAYPLGAREDVLSDYGFDAAGRGPVRLAPGRTASGQPLSNRQERMHSPREGPQITIIRT